MTSFFDTHEFMSWTPSGRTVTDLDNKKKKWCAIFTVNGSKIINRFIYERKSIKCV